MTQPSTDNAAPGKDTSHAPPRADAPPRGIGQGTRVQHSSAGTVPVGAESAPATSQGSVAAANLVEPPAVMPAKSDATAAIESLDAQLAELTAQLLDPKVGPAPMVPQEPARAPVVPVVPASTAEKPAAASAPAAAAPAPAAIAPVAPPTVPVQAPASPPVKPIPNRAEARKPGALLATFARMSRPLAGKPALVRVAAGAIGVNSLLLAAGVWAFVVMRPAPSGAVEKEYDFASSSLPMAPVEREPERNAHAGAGSEGGEEAAKGADKKGAKPPAKAGKKAAKPPAKTEEHAHE